MNHNYQLVLLGNFGAWHSCVYFGTYPPPKCYSTPDGDAHPGDGVFLMAHEVRLKALVTTENQVHEKQPRCDRIKMHRKNSLVHWKVRGQAQQEQVTI